MGKDKRERSLGEKEALARVKMIRVSPQKLNLVAKSVRGMPVSDAVQQLAFSNKAVAKDVKKVLEAAIANAENNHMLDVDQLYVAEATVGKALVMKRFRARARGRAASIKKPFSNLRIIVREREEA